MLTESASTTLLRPKALAEEIVAILQREIIAGGFQPGQRLVERDLNRRFGVSSIPVREALLELEARGLVTRRHNIGCSVVQLTATEAARLCELRRLVEPKVMEWAAERITPAAVAELESQLALLEKAAESRDLAAFFQHDMDFHRLIWTAAENPYAERALLSTMGSLFASGLIRSRTGDSIDMTAEYVKHKQLLEAIAAHDGQRAALALLEIAAGFERHLPKQV